MTTIDSRHPTVDPAGEANVLLRAVGLTKTFGSKVAVDNVDLTLRAGEIHALLGENGAGKSTVISMLSGQYRVDSGDIEIHGNHVRLSGPKDSLKQGVGVVYQDFRLVNDFSVLDNLVLGTGSSPSRAAWNKALEVMEPLGFALPRDAKVSALTVGEKQQLEILKLLYRGADILILDEPTAVLTPQQSTSLFQALRILADGGKAIMFVSHKLREVSDVADHITVLRGGRMVLTQPAERAQPDELATMMLGEDLGREKSVESGNVRENVLELREICTEPGRRSSLRDINFSVRRGEIVGVAGVSGNGQTDLAEVIAHTRTPVSGDLSFSGSTISYVPEDRLADGLVGRMTIAENLALRSYKDRDYHRSFFVSRRTMAEQAHPLIHAFGIPAQPYVTAGELSGGGQQRTILARELSSDPDLLVISQPTRGLDVASARSIHAEIVRVRDKGCGVLLVSEDLDEILKLADRVIVMVNGRAVAEFDRSSANRMEIGRYMTDAQTEEAHARIEAERGADEPDTNSKQGA